MGIVSTCVRRSCIRTVRRFATTEASRRSTAEGAERSTVVLVVDLVFQARSKSMAIVRICTSTVIGLLPLARTSETDTMRCGLLCRFGSGVVI